MLNGIVYISNAVCEFDDAALQELADQSSAKNKKINVTGYLYFSRRKFFQYIEGPAQTTLALMDTIREDVRHQVTEELHLRDQPRQLFPGWNMRWLHKPELQSLQIEHTLSDFMAAKSSFADDEYWEKRIWEMISHLAANQRQIPIATGPIESSNVDRILDAGL